LGTPDEEKCVAGDEKRIGPIALKLCESRIDLAAGAGVENFELKSEGRGSRFDVSQRRGVVALAGLTRTATRAAPGNVRFAPVGSTDRRNTCPATADQHIVRLAGSLLSMTDEALCSVDGFALLGRPATGR
jgi:hypothetical protein